MWNLWGIVWVAVGVLVYALSVWGSFLLGRKMATDWR